MSFDVADNIIETGDTAVERRNWRNLIIALAELASGIDAGSGLTTGVIPKATGSTSLGDSLLSESGTALTAAAHVYPSLDSSWDLGSNSLRWANGYLDTLTLTNPLAITSGGTGADNAADARANLGLGTIATQDADNVSITGGSISGITDLSVADGGTGASTAADARTNLGLEPADILGYLLGVDGAGSNLDADLLDGLEGSAYAVLAEDETVTGAWSFTGKVFILNQDMALVVAENDSITAPAGQYSLFIKTPAAGGSYRHAIGVQATQTSDELIHGYNPDGNHVFVVNSTADDSGFVGVFNDSGFQGDPYSNALFSAGAQHVFAGVEIRASTLAGNAGQFVSLDGDGDLEASGSSPSDFAAASHTHPWSEVTTTPTTLSGYGITDAAPLSHVGAGGAAHAQAVASGAAGFMSGADKAKLDGIAAGANNYTHPNHTGDVTSVGDGATTIANDAVSNAKLANMAGDTIKGRSGTTGDPQDLTATQVRTILNVEDGATADQTGAEILALLLSEDGSGSGLDADLLDGNHASAFALASHTHATSDITSGSFDDARIAESNVTQHAAALSIAWGQITSTPTTLSGYGITDAQALDAGLTSIAGLTTAADRMIYTTAMDSYAVTPLTSFARSLLDDADAAAMRATLDLEPGTDVQAYDAGLASIAGLTTAADKMLYLTASDTYAVADLTSFARSLLDDADAATARTTLGLGTAATSDAGDFATAAQGALADSAVQPGDDADTLGSGAATNGQVLTADGAGNTSWTSAGGVSGSGTSGKLAKFTGASSIGNSIITETGSTIQIDGDLQLTGSNRSVLTDGEWQFVADGSGGFVLQNTDTGEVAFNFTKADGHLTISDVNITGGAIAGITDLAVADGGTGASTASGARSNLGLGTAATSDSGDFATDAQGTLADSAVQPGDDADTLGSGSATNGQVLTADGSGGASWEDAAAGLSGSGTNNQLAKWSGGALTGSTVTDDGTNVLTSGEIRSGGAIKPSNDYAFYLIKSGTNPIINFDPNDYLAYLRTANTYRFHIGASAILDIDSAGIKINGGPTLVYWTGSSWGAVMSSSGLATSTNQNIEYHVIGTMVILTGYIYFNENAKGTGYLYWTLPITCKVGSPGAQGSLRTWGVNTLNGEDNTIVRVSQGSNELRFENCRDGNTPDQMDPSQFYNGNAVWFTICYPKA